MLPFKYLILRIQGSNWYDLNDVYQETITVDNEEQMAALLGAHREYLHNRVLTNRLSVASLYVVDLHETTIRKEYEFFGKQKTRMEVNKSDKKAKKIKMPAPGDNWNFAPPPVAPGQSLDDFLFSLSTQGNLVESEEFEETAS